MGEVLPMTKDPTNLSLPELATRIRDGHEQTRKQTANAIVTAMQTGDYLIAAQVKFVDELKRSKSEGSTAAFGFETWEQWVCGNCIPAFRSAKVYMQLARKRKEIEHVMNDGVDMSTSIRSALRLIAKSEPDISKTARIRAYLQTGVAKSVKGVREHFPDIHPQRVTTIINDMAKSGEVKDTRKREKTSEGGRPAIVYAYNQAFDPAKDGGQVKKRKATAKLTPKQVHKAFVGSLKAMPDMKRFIEVKAVCREAGVKLTLEGQQTTNKPVAAKQLSLKEVKAQFTELLKAMSNFERHDTVIDLVKPWPNLEVRFNVGTIPIGIMGKQRTRKRSNKQRTNADQGEVK